MKVFAYARVSTGRQADNDISIPDQFRQINNWCSLNGHEIVGEYKDEGLSGTDDNRPGFQEMLGDAYVPNSPAEAIAVYSLSRIFRNHLMLGNLLIDLKKHKVKFISISQQTPEDAAGELMRSQFALFDEYTSKQNAANTLRCMISNAKRGYFNGSRVPFGYQLHYTDEPARTGVKKILKINPDEAKIVTLIFNLYIDRNLGVKGVASHLNEKGLLRRGKLWSTSTIHLVLKNTVYKGQKLFNQREWRTGEAKPENEVIKISVDPIVTEEVFDLAQYKREQRRPSRTHPKRLSSPRLLTGLLRCGDCGAAMTMATGTGMGGTYNYYRCTTKSKKHIGLCSSKPVPMEKFDRQILNGLAEKVFTPERVAFMLTELKQKIDGSGIDISDLQKQVKVVQHKIDKLYDAIENGYLPMDEETKSRMDGHKTKRAEIQAKIENYQYSPKASVDTIDSKDVDNWCGLLREKLLDPKSGFAKEYLQLLIKEIVLTKNEVKVSGDSRALVGAIKFRAEKINPTTANSVIGFNKVWRAWRDSNSRPTDS